MWPKKKVQMGDLLAAMVDATVWVEFQDRSVQLQGVGILLLERVHDELSKTFNLGTTGTMLGKLSEAIKRSGKVSGLPNSLVTYLFDWNSVEPGPDEFDLDKDRTLKIWGGAMTILREEIKVL